MFESCVVLDGDKTRVSKGRAQEEFESCVVLDGDKTDHTAFDCHFSLRVVLF